MAIVAWICCDSHTPIFESLTQNMHIMAAFLGCIHITLKQVKFHSDKEKSSSRKSRRK